MKIFLGEGYIKGKTSLEDFSMFIETPLPFVKAFIEDVNNALKESKLGAGLTLIQKTWLYPFV